jgi:hypothetical protein
MLKTAAARLSFAVLLTLPAVMLGQGNYAGIIGTVTDSAGAVTPKAVVTIRHTGTNITRVVTTDSAGNYAATNLPPGVYELTGSLDGFRTYHLGGIVLETGQTRRIDFQLQVGEIVQSVEVTADVPALNTDKGAVVGSVINQREIQELPLDSRSIMDLALLVPGVLPQAEGGLGSGINTGGARSEGNNF